MSENHIQSWTDTFTKTILSASLKDVENHVDEFLLIKIKGSLQQLKDYGEKINDSANQREFYDCLRLFTQEAKQCLYWYERSLEYELVDLSNSKLIIEQSKAMINVLESVINVINHQGLIN
ncbi:MAG: hypothetical protein NT126_11185 [Bacteroidetes bacterium]|nr:hypothetical protein [Bacteroidota bacterium]